MGEYNWKWRTYVINIRCHLAPWFKRSSHNEGVGDDSNVLVRDLESDLFIKWQLFFQLKELASEHWFSLSWALTLAHDLFSGEVDEVLWATWSMSPMA